jgi:hypothetical protein
MCDNQLIEPALKITPVMLLTTDLAQLKLANPHQLLTSISESHE